MANVLVLYQYQIKGEHFHSYEVKHNGDVTEMFNELPFLYCVNVVKKEQGNITPHGGFIVKTDIPKDDPNVSELMYNVAAQLDKVSEILPFANTIQATPTKYSSNVVPNEDECKKLAAGAVYLYGWGGSA